MLNVSRRLVSHALKVLRHGCHHLIEAVESGAVAVSAASVLAAQPAEDQARALAGGPQAAAAQARELRKSKNKPIAGRPCPGSFGILPNQGPGGQEADTGNSVVFLWVAAGGLAEAIDALQARGFRYSE